MEENFYYSAFEELIKEKADEYKMYPSDKVWKNINRSLHRRRKWYWSGFVLLLSGISYLAVTELLSPPAEKSLSHPVQPAAAPASSGFNAREFVPFSAAPLESQPPAMETVISAITVEDSGSITAAFEIPLRLLNHPHAPELWKPDRKASLLISGLAPLNDDEAYNIEVSWPLPGILANESPAWMDPNARTETESSSKRVLKPLEKENRINWLQDHAAYVPPTIGKRVHWQLAFSPTVNYRKLTGGNGLKSGTGGNNVDLPPTASESNDPEKLVNHKPALGFELGAHGLLPLTPRLTLKGGLQFNYSKYDIVAFRAPVELATISLNSSTGLPGNALTSYTDIRNFSGYFAEDLKNQYYQLSVPVGLELRVLGSDKLQFNIAGTIQPTYMLNKNTYLITNDYKNYTREPSLVRKWNVNAGAEAFISYSSGDIKWQVGPQFRYQLLSSYKNEYPIKEYLMEYGIKVGISKTIR